MLPLDEASPDWATRAGGPDIVKTLDGRDAIRVAEHWSSINIIVAGGAGKHSAWIPTFGNIDMTKTIMRRIERRDGSPVRSIYDLAR